jgi:hypothetical protein
MRPDHVFRFRTEIVPVHKNFQNFLNRENSKLFKDFSNFYH